MKTILLISALLLALALPLSAQVSISTSNSAPDPSAMLDVKSSTRGVLLPRMTNAERDAIADPATGLFIYNIEEQMLQVYDGTAWKLIYTFPCMSNPPDTIYGNNYPGCYANGVVYSISRVPWASSYHWTVPPGATVTSGQGGTIIAVEFGSQGGDVSVRAQGGCGNSDYKSLPVTVAITAAPAVINGKSHPDCNEGAVVYYVDPVPGATTYHWTVSSGATISGGQSTNSITVDFGTTGGEISVRTENSCGNSAYTSMSYVIGIPAQPETITGTASPYKNSTGVPYFISPVPGATSYLWTVPSDATIASGQGTDSITVNIGVQSGNISVRVQNSCGNSAYTDLPVVPFACGDVITDLRDSKTYPTIQIGSQCWMKKNMNIGTMINTDVPQSRQFPEVIEKYCYNNVEDSCSIYGGLYQWDEMMQYSTTGGSQGICPAGWHVATDAEWCKLENYVDSDTVDCGRGEWGGTDAGGNLKEAGTTHWSPNNGATNSSGFTALPAGFVQNGSSGAIRVFARFWTSISPWTGLATDRLLYAYYATIAREIYFNTSVGMSVRCMK